MTPRSPDGDARFPVTGGRSRTDRPWLELRGYADLLRDRASGQAAEMESAKSLCRLLEDQYRPGMSVLDVGCGPGHYLRSLQRRLDPEVDYTGLDLTLAFLALGRRVVPRLPLAAGEVLALPFPDRAFDLVVCSNLLLHLPPPPEPALAELARVARRRLLVRTPLGRRNYVIQEVREPHELEPGGPAAAEEGLFDAGGAPRRFNYFNLYTESYLSQAARSAAPGARVRLEPDREFEAFDNRDRTTLTGTRVVEGRQLAGNLLLEWWWLELEWDESA